MRETTIRPQKKQEVFLRTNADVAIFGGSAGGGKTYSILLEPLYHKRIKGFEAVIFRRTYSDITRPGGLWDESEKLYPLFGGDSNLTSRSWTFNGGKVTFAGLQYETDLESWRGAQICMLGFDQLETFTYQQFLYMMSRNRSTCGVKPYVRATCNPEPGWLADFLDWWIADDGYADLSRAGKKRWFIMQDEQIIWGNTRDEMSKRYPDMFPRSCTFIPSTIYDNQILLEKDPNYLANLQGLSLVDRERLLGDRERGGNWKIKPAAGNVFNRSWFGVINDWDKNASGWRAVLRFDLAATAPSVKNPDPDYTAWCVMTYNIESKRIVLIEAGNAKLEPIAVYQKLEQLARGYQEYFRDLGIPYKVRWEEEPGSAGKRESRHTLVPMLAGIDAKGVRSSGEKIARARPLAAYVENGNVDLLRGNWNEAYLAHMHNQPAEHDDMMDASSGAFADLVSNRLQREARSWQG